MTYLTFTADLVTLANKLHAECDEFEMAEFLNALCAACDGTLSVNFEELDEKAFHMIDDLAADLRTQSAA